MTPTSWPYATAERVSLIHNFVTTNFTYELNVSYLKNEEYISIGSDPMLICSA